MLSPKVRALLERMVSAGVPPMVAGSTYGILPKTISSWLREGMRYLDEGLKTPAQLAKTDDMYHPDQDLDLGAGIHTTRGGYYKHQKECLALARTVVKCEGALVKGLVGRMWQASVGNTDMMKFLFKHYSHVHGLVEPKQGVEVKATDEKGSLTSGGLMLYLPHNGREDEVGPMSKKPGKK